MNQIVHIFRKDCRGLWSYIAAVLVLTFLHGYGVVIISGGMVAGLSPRVLLMILAGLSVILLPIALFLLVVSVVQEESLVGSDKFWLTRPYSRLNLFLEKLLFVLVWAVLPMLLHDVVLVRYFGFSLTSAFGLLIWKTAQFGLFLLVAAGLAVLSASFGRAVVHGFVAVLIALLTFLVVMQNAGDSIVGAPYSANYVLRALLVVAALGALAVVAFQYRFRITSVAALIGVIAILACNLLVRFWPASLTAHLSKRFASPIVTAVQLLPDANLTGRTRPPTFENADAQAHTVYYPFRAVGLANDVGITVNGVSAELSSHGPQQSFFYLPQQVRFQPANASGLFADAEGPDQLVPFSVGRPDDTKPLKDTDGALSGKLYLEGYRSSVVRLPVPLPYQPQKFAVAGRRCTVEAGHREAIFILRFDCVELEPGNTSRMQVHLLQDNQEVIPQGTQDQSSSQGSWPSFLSPIVRTNFSYEFSPQASADFLTGEPPRNRNMLVFAEESLGTQERPFRIEDFRAADLSLSAWEQRGGLKVPEHNPAPFVLQPGARPGVTR